MLACDCLYACAAAARAESCEVIIGSVGVCGDDLSRTGGCCASIVGDGFLSTAGSVVGSPRLKRLNSERRRWCCGSGDSAVVLEVASRATEGGVAARACGEESEEDPRSGLAIRRPPKDCDRLRSPFMATRPTA